MKEVRKSILMFVFLIAVILMTGIVGAVSWNESDVDKIYYFVEDTTSYHNFTENLEDASDLSYFKIIDISWVNGTINDTEHSNYYWLPWNDTGFSNSSTGVLKIDATRDNETGNFTLNVLAQGTEGGVSRYFHFIINATNDAPYFVNINQEYNLYQNINFIAYINASDEEEHYPLVFNINFYDNCTLAAWSTRGEGNCSLFNLTSVSNTSAMINFTPTRNDVGVYWANISVTDYGENYSCPNSYCDENYTKNKTTYSQVIVFNVFSSLTINVSDCQNKIFQENESGTCHINITTRGEKDLLNISSIAILRNYNGNVSNVSWFYPTNLTNSSNFAQTVFINVTPQKTEIGNWTINFTVQDLTSGENMTKQIYVYVNRTFNDDPELLPIENRNTSVHLLTRINLTVYDDDLLIPDKNDNYGGYNETINFTIKIFNQSNLSQELNISGFEVEILNMPVAGTNRTEAKIEFTPNESDVGDYTINISVNDRDGAIDSRVFNLTIIDNHAPLWNETMQKIFEIYEGNLTYLNLSQNVSDPDGDTLTFSFSNDTAFHSFNLTSDGIINFTAVDEDVGQHLVNVTVSDGYLTNTTLLNFTIYNINDAPHIDNESLSADNATVDGLNVNAQADNVTKLIIYIHDDDFKIPLEQRAFYNETLNVTTLILNSTGDKIDWFDFSFANYIGGETSGILSYEADFTPHNSNAGMYNVTINVTDMSNASDSFTFYLNVSPISHKPVLMPLTNQTSAINRTLYYDINASDEEDGTDMQGNLTFTITFLPDGKGDFINNNETIFNTTSGVLNVTFNATQGGKYHLNVSVNDSSGNLDSQDFWIFVYDVPQVIFPTANYNFTLQENIASYLNFSVNHSVGDNLTYLFYVDNIVYNGSDFNYENLSLRDTVNYYGDGTNLTWEFTPNFTDETYGLYKNLTLVVYPANPELENASDLNMTIRWNLNITHTNAPVNFSGYIGDKQTTYDKDIVINLFQYFSDIDHSDLYYNQTINFSITSNATQSYITASISNWILTLSSYQDSVVTTELITINATDLNSDNEILTSAASNSFQVEFTKPSTTVVTRQTSGGGGTTPVSLKIILPDPISAYKKERIKVPITLSNTGRRTLYGINLTAIVVKDSVIRKDIGIEFDKSYFYSLGIGKKENLTLTIYVNTDEVGLYEITINASVRDPRYNDWGKLYLTVKEKNKTEILETILFIEEFIAENPECIELKELVNEAKKYYDNNQYALALEKSKQAIDACKYAIAQQNLPRVREKLEDKFYRYLTLFSLIAFIGGISYYSYKKMKLRRAVLR